MVEYILLVTLVLFTVVDMVAATLASFKGNFESEKIWTLRAILSLQVLTFMGLH